MRYHIDEFDITISNGRWCVDYYNTATNSWETILITVALACHDRNGYRYLRSLIKSLTN